MHSIPMKKEIITAYSVDTLNSNEVLIFFFLQSHAFESHLVHRQYIAMAVIYMQYTASISKYHIIKNNINKYK